MMFRILKILAILKCQAIFRVVVGTSLVEVIWLAT